MVQGKEHLVGEWGQLGVLVAWRVYHAEQRWLLVTRGKESAGGQSTECTKSFEEVRFLK